MGYPHHPHVQGPMGSCMDPKFPPGEDYTNGYANMASAGAHQSPDYLSHPAAHHHHPHVAQTNSFSPQSMANNYNFYHHNHYQVAAATQHHAVVAAAAAAVPANNYSNGYYGSYYGTPTVPQHASTPIMDLPLQCPPAEPQNTALGLHELGEKMRSADGLWF